MRVTILGITGYTGKELLRLLLKHPMVTEIVPVSTSQPDTLVSDIDRSAYEGHPKLATTNYKTLSIERAQDLPTETLFSCLPHRHSHRACLLFLGKTKIIDLSADFRLEPHNYETVYGIPFPELPPDCTRAYGLCELYRDSIQNADIVAIPGCFAGTILSVLLPLHRSRLLPKNITCVALTGISGAGKQTNEQFSYCERNENITAYAPIHTHRHVFEIEEKLDNAAQIQFTPVLAPLQRGIYAILSMQSEKPEQLMQAIETQYQNEAFVTVTKDYIPSLSDVLYTNHYRIGAVHHSNTVQCYACSDNLLKGACGQAIQCFNSIHNINEDVGL